MTATPMNVVLEEDKHWWFASRTRAILRRGRDEAVLPDIVEAAGVRVDVERHQVSVDGVEVAFALREFELLELLVRNAGRVMTRGQPVSYTHLDVYKRQTS